jgi:hypothetical protein
MRAALAVLLGGVVGPLSLGAQSDTAQGDTAPARADTVRYTALKDTTPEDSLRGDTTAAASPPEEPAGGHGLLGTKGPFNPQPSQAVKWGLLIPGGGQIYNRDWWKLPIVYGALGGAAYAVVLNHQQYRQLDRQYQQTTSEQNPRGDQTLKVLRDSYRKNRDLSIILGALGYALSAVEAFVDAHLYHFDVSPDLSLRMQPRVLYDNRASGGLQPGLSLSLHLR